MGPDGIKGQGQSLLLSTQCCAVPGSQKVPHTRLLSEGRRDVSRQAASGPGVEASGSFCHTGVSGWPHSVAFGHLIILSSSSGHFPGESQAHHLSVRWS